MKVLSLFDGMSCGQLALNRLGIKVDKYYASEIDKYAIQVTQANFPETIQIGDVCDVKGKDYQDIDIIFAGSPCQGFSQAGKGLAFDDPRSALFFEFIRLLKEIKPKYFLLENVKMKKEWLQIITEQVSACYPEYTNSNNLFGGGIEPILINSSLLSAQSRQRYYWTNIPNVEQPEERGIVLRDILEDQPQDPTLMSDKFVARNGDRNCMIDKTKEKAHNLSAMEYVKNGRQGNYLACDENGVPQKLVDDTNDLPENINRIYDNDSKSHKPIKVGNIYPSGGQNGNIFSADGKSPTLSAGQGKTGRGIGSNNAPKIETHDKPKHIGTAVDINGHDQIKRVYSPDGKSPTITTCGGGHREPKVIVGAYRGRYNEDGSTSQKLELRKDEKTNTITTVQKDNVLTKDEVYWRKLTPLECMRLQTVQDDYLMPVSNTQRYKMLGNGWTIDVICHILKNMD